MSFTTKIMNWTWTGLLPLRSQPRTLCMLENLQARSVLTKAIEHREFGDLPDPRMENRFDENEMFHMIVAAAACIRHSAAMRPRMGQVSNTQCAPSFLLLIFLNGWHWQRRIKT